MASRSLSYRAAKRIGLLVAATLLSLGAAEFGLRWVYPHGASAESIATWPWLMADPVLGFKNKEGYTDENLAINSLNLRGPEVVTAPSSGTLRVICLGDSRTFGIWTDLGRQRYDSDYPRLLGEVLESWPGAPPAEVINAGVIGHSSSHGLRFLQTRLARLKPHVVTAAFGVNDHCLSIQPSRRCRELRSPLARCFLATFCQYRTLQLPLAAVQGIGRLHPKPLSVPWTSPEEYAHNLTRFAEESRAYGFHLLFLKIPLRPLDLGENKPLFPGAKVRRTPYALLGATDLQDLHRLNDRYQTILVQTAEMLGVPVVDMPVQADSFGPYDLVHPTDKGARAIAHRIAETLDRLGWFRPL